MAYDFTMNALTALFVLIMLLPFALNLIIHLIHVHQRHIRRTPDNRVWINGKDVTNTPIKDFHHG